MTAATALDDLIDEALRPTVRRLGSVAYTFGPMDPTPVWARDLGAMIGGLRRDSALLRKAAAVGLTRDRLLAMAEGLAHNAGAYADVFGEAGLAPDPSVAPATSAPWMLATSGTTMRDWAWEPNTDENRDALADVLEVWPDDAATGTMLVLGAGAGRLGVDLHVARNATRTVLLDSNPLPLLIAAKVLRGDPLRLYELPRNPAAVSDAAAARDLSSPHAEPDAIALLAADGRKPPFSPGRFDAVVTPWYIDQVEQPYRSLLPTIRRALRPGGVWVNHGPLIYDRRPLPDQLTLEELVAQIRSSGFELGAVRSRRAPYLHAPGSTHGRVETVHSFAARAAGSG